MSGPHYYNELDPYPAQWLRNLIAAGHIPAGDVDERSITDVQPDDLRGYVQCHFFAGIGGWPLALKLAGWPTDRPVWTGSCPCQPFSVAGKARGSADSRHLWPQLFRLVRECRPAILFGEQVAAAVKHGWIDSVFADMEGVGYACAATVIPAVGVGAPHRRDRLWFIADAAGHGLERVQYGISEQVPENRTPKTLASWNNPCDSFADWEKLMAVPYVRRLANGVSSELEVRPALRAYGNAIVPQVAAQVISAYMECRP